jgi:hypothetical protein
MKYLKTFLARLCELIVAYILLVIGTVELIIELPVITVMYLFNGKKFDFIPFTTFLSEKLDESW